MTRIRAELGRLAAAFQFITALPMGRATHYDPRGMIAYFPLVGLILGIGLAAVDAAAGVLFRPGAMAVVDMVYLVLVTGALHLDGLGDTADGLMGHHDRDRALAIMKDSRIGAMGLVAVVCCLAVKWAGLSGIAHHRRLALVVIPALSRAGMIAGIHRLPYGRPGGGTGFDLFESPITRADYAWVLVPALLALAMGVRGLALLAAAAATAAGIIAWYRRRIGCITGDMLGAMTEVAEAVLFLIAAAGGVR